MTKSASEKMTKSFSFYDISKLENLGLEDKKELLFGKKIEFHKSNKKLPSCQNSDLIERNDSLIIETEKKTSIDKVDLGFDTKVKSIHEKENIEKRFYGELKLFFEKENYGFIKCEEMTDVFVSFVDLKKAGFTKNMIKTFKNQKLSFRVFDYERNSKKSRKAIDIEITN